MPNELQIDETPSVDVESRRAQLPDLLDELEQLTSKLGHDLRGPLNWIFGYSELLKGERPGPLNAEQKQLLERISKGAVEIGGMIDQCQERINRLNRSRSRG